MKYILAFLIFVSNQAWSYYEQTFKVSWVGMSNNTNTITINVEEAAQNTSCSDKKLFRVPDNEKMADLLFSAAMAAQAQKISIVFGYEENDCLNNGTVPRTFRIGS